MQQQKINNKEWEKRKRKRKERAKKKFTLGDHQHGATNDFGDT